MVSQGGRSQTDMTVLDRDDVAWAAVEAGLWDQWHALCASADVRALPVGLTRLGEQLVLWRDGAGTVHVMADRCPHRGAALSRGRVAGNCIACGYHGVEVAADGSVARVPAFDGAGLEGKKLVRVYPVIEHNQAIYAWFGSDPNAQPADLELTPELRDPDWDGFLCVAVWGVGLVWQT